MTDSKPLALIVEDSPEQAAIYAKALEMANYTTEVVSDGQDAITRLTGAVPSLILLDLNLPYVDGDEILRQVRANERYNDTNVILATANPMMAEPLWGESDLVLIKPVSFKQLRDLASRLNPVID